MVEWCNRKVERFKAENRNRKAEAGKRKQEKIKKYVRELARIILL